MATSGSPSYVTEMIEGIAEPWLPILSLQFHNNCSESPSTLLCHECDCNDFHGIQGSVCRDKGCFKKRGNKFHRIRPEEEPQWYTCHGINSEEPDGNECHETGCFTKLCEFIRREQTLEIPIWPSAENVFRWTTFCSPDEVKVVILGQDPYHTEGRATGLAFSVEKKYGLQPSVGYIYDALENDALRKDSSITFERPDHGDLTSWAKQGVLLLNTVLTVRQDAANSHAGKGWERITDGVIKYINENCNNVVFMLWGEEAQKKHLGDNPKKHLGDKPEEKLELLDTEKHRVLLSSHPASRDNKYRESHTEFFNCGHFSKANDYLKENGKNPVNWNSLLGTLEEKITQVSLEVAMVVVRSKVAKYI